MKTGSSLFQLDVDFESGVTGYWRGGGRVGWLAKREPRDRRIGVPVSAEAPSEITIFELACAGA